MELEQGQRHVEVDVTELAHEGDTVHGAATPGVNRFEDQVVEGRTSKLLSPLECECSGVKP